MNKEPTYTPTTPHITKGIKRSNGETRATAAPKTQVVSGRIVVYKLLNSMQ